MDELQIKYFRGGGPWRIPGHEIFQHRMRLPARTARRRKHCNLDRARAPGRIRSHPATQPRPQQPQSQSPMPRRCGNVADVSASSASRSVDLLTTGTIWLATIRADGKGVKSLRMTVKALLPTPVRTAAYEARHFGARDYLRYRWRRLTMSAQPEVVSNAPFRIGADAAIVLHESSIAGINAHFVDNGRGTAELDALRRLAPGHRTFLDIGAASGLFAAAFCAITGASAFGFEPSPALFAGMADLFDLNSGLDLTPINLALGAFAGTMSVISSSNAQFRAVDAAPQLGDTDVMPVEMLDDFVRAWPTAPDFAKVDVEGMELDVLRGGAETFGAADLDALLLEVHPNIINDANQVSEIESLLHELGFDLFTLRFAPIGSLAGYIANGPPARRRATNIACLKGCGEVRPRD
jgi:FkbM family methyltransferase